MIKEVFTISKLNEILQYFFDNIETYGFKYALLQKYDNLEYVLKNNSDIDYCSNIDEYHLDIIIKKILIKFNNEVFIFNKFSSKIPNTLTYDLHLNNEKRNIRLDLYNDLYGVSFHGIKTEEFLKFRKRFNNFYIVSFPYEFLYKVVKNINKKSFTKQQIFYLNNLLNSDFEKISKITYKYLGKNKFTEQLLDSISNNSVPENKYIAIIEKSLIKKSFLKKIKYLPFIFFYNNKLIFKRTLNTYGETIFIISNHELTNLKIIKKLSEKFKYKLVPGFRNVVILNFNYFKSKNSGTHHLKKKTFFSFIKKSKMFKILNNFWKLCCLTFCYLKYYLFKILPKKIKGNLVILNAFCYNTIDIKNFKMKLPLSFFKSILKIIPKPELTVILYSSEKKLNISRNMFFNYFLTNFFVSLQNLIITSNENTSNNFADKITEFLIKKREEKIRNNLLGDPIESIFFFNRNLRYFCFPSKNNIRFILPEKTKIIKKVIDLEKYDLRKKAYYSLENIIFRSKFFNKKNILNHDLFEFSEEFRNIIKEKIFKTDNIILSLSKLKNQKILYVFSKTNDIIGYIKINENSQKRQKIYNEEKILKKLNGKITDNIYVPKVLYKGSFYLYDFIVLSFPQSFEKFRKLNFCNQKNYFQLLHELSLSTLKIISFQESEFFKNLERSFNEYKEPFKDFLEFSISKLLKKFNSTNTLFSISQGSFIPSNIFWSKNGKAFIKNWENSEIEAPIFIDSIHFSFIEGFYKKKLRGRILLNFMLNHKLINSLFDSISEKYKSIDIKALTLTYLIKTILDKKEVIYFSEEIFEKLKLIDLILKSLKE